TARKNDGETECRVDGCGTLRCARLGGARRSARRGGRYIAAPTRRRPVGSEYDFGADRLADRRGARRARSPDAGGERRGRPAAGVPTLPAALRYAHFAALGAAPGTERCRARALGRRGSGSPAGGG